MNLSKTISCSPYAHMIDPLICDFEQEDATVGIYSRVFKIDHVSGDKRILLVSELDEREEISPNQRVPLFWTQAVKN